MLLIPGHTSITKNPQDNARIAKDIAASFQRLAEVAEGRTGVENYHNTCTAAVEYFQRLAADLVAPDTVPWYRFSKKHAAARRQAAAQRATFVDGNLSIVRAQAQCASGQPSFIRGVVYTPQATMIRALNGRVHSVFDAFSKLHECYQPTFP